LLSIKDGRNSAVKRCETSGWIFAEITPEFALEIDEVREALRVALGQAFRRMSCCRFHGHLDIEFCSMGLFAVFRGYSTLGAWLAKVLECRSGRRTLGLVNIVHPLRLSWPFIGIIQVK
jgi:hypothetical protein